MQLFEVMRSTFAARDFTDDPLPDDVIFEILDNARFAPSGGNRQGNRVIIVRDNDSRAQLAKLVVPAAKKYIAQTQLGESPWNTIVPTKVTPSQIEQAVVPEMLFDQYTSAQVVLVFLVNLELVASIGFGGSITTLPIAEEPLIKELFRIPSNFAVCALVPMGRPKKQLAKLSRRSVEEIASLESFDGKPLTKLV